MKDIRNKLLIITGIVLGGLAVIVGIRALLPRAPRPEESPRQKPAALNSQATVSDRQIQKAQALIEQKPSDPQGYNLLCAAYMKKARETGDFGYNARAEAALKRSLELSPPAENYDGVRMQAALLLVYHRFNEALEAARRAQAIRPQDPLNYGAMTDALVELGDYTEAFQAAQTMMDLRPNSSSYSRVSYLRELQGDTAGAIEAMRAAAESAGDPETAAWCRVHLGDLLLNDGKIAAAEHELDNALYTFPDYHAAFAAKARARLAAGETIAAVEFYKRAEARVPLPETAIALGDLYAKLGQAQEAKKQYDLLELIERTSAAYGTYSRQLALFYADHDMKLDDALAIAQRERATRSDIFTCDALAWCLYKKGQFAEAKTAIDEALRLGTRDARINYHAGMIQQSLGNRRDAARYLQLALNINPFFDALQADVARQTLRALTT
ncbi:MAG: tetratricopeptide repeat protein [Pyrinomonadaceae bacterium]